VGLSSDGRNGPKTNRNSKQSRGAKKSSRGGKRVPSGLPVRRAAVDVLFRIFRHGEPLDRALEDVLSQDAVASMEHRDRALVRLLVTTALRRRGQIDDVLKNFLAKPLPKRSGAVGEILLIAITQILFLKTPPHAAINIAVEQCRMDRRGQHLAKLANAVLRRVSEGGEEILARQNSARLNSPDWIWDKWSAAFGEDTAQKIADAHQSHPALDVSVKSDPERWATLLDGIILPSGSVRLQPKGRIEDLPGFDEGDWWVQDVAATLPVKMLGDVRGLRIADLCSAPGGKTALLASLGGDVVSVDSSASRLARVVENLDRLKLKAEIVEADILQWEPGETFDVVLLDAPCSATGTIRRHPDIPFIKNPKDSEELAQLQREMLVRGGQLVKPGGRLVFCTCSLDEVEGEQHLDFVSREMLDFEIEAVDGAGLGWPQEWTQSGGYLRTLPHFLVHEQPGLSGMDGFFAVKFLKKASEAS